MGAHYVSFEGVAPAITYDEYCAGAAGGPGLDYWWKLNHDFDASAIESNYGSAGSADLECMFSFTGNAQDTGLVNGTADALSVEFTGANWEWLNADSVRVDGSQRFAAGGWFIVPTGAADQLLFRSNMGGTQGYWRGVDILYSTGSTALAIVLGTNSIAGSKFFYRLITASGAFARDVLNFLVLDVTPTLDPLTVGLTLYINGVAVSLSFSDGTGDTIAWPVTDSSPNNWNGIAFGAAGDTYGNKANFQVDEVFFHLGGLTSTQVTTMYSLGS